MASVPNRRLTEEEYLAMERTADSKSEFHDGETYAMAGGSPRHALLQAAIAALFRSHLPGCLVFGADLRIKAESARTYTYADASAVCGELELVGEQQDCVSNPCLIAEVLSPSTEAYDRGKKFEIYRTIPTFCEYLLIHPDRRRVEHYSKQEAGGWLLRDLMESDAIVLTRWRAEIAVANLYAGMPGIGDDAS